MSFLHSPDQCCCAVCQWCTSGTIPDQYDFTIPDASADLCGNCDELSGTYRLSRIESPTAQQLADSLCPSNGCLWGLEGLGPFSCTTELYSVYFYVVTNSSTAGLGFTIVSGSYRAAAKAGGPTGFDQRESITESPSIGGANPYDCSVTRTMNPFFNSLNSPVRLRQVGVGTLCQWENGDLFTVAAV